MDTGTEESGLKKISVEGLPTFSVNSRIVLDTDNPETQKVLANYDYLNRYNSGGIFIVKEVKNHECTCSSGKVSNFHEEGCIIYMVNHPQTISVVKEGDGNAKPKNISGVFFKEVD